MKYNVGDLVFVKHCEYKPRPRLRLRLHPRLHPDIHPHIINTYGVITEAFNHRDAWQGESTEDDNVYFWYSQVSAKTYWFFEEDLIQYEVVK